MKIEYLTEEQVLSYLEMGGRASFVFYFEDILANIEELDGDKDKIAELSLEYAEKYDKMPAGRSMSIESAIKIIKADKVLFALLDIVNRNGVDKEAVEKAQELIQKIVNLEIRLPKLD